MLEFNEEEPKYTPLIIRFHVRIVGLLPIPARALNRGAERNGKDDYVTWWYGPAAHKSIQYECNSAHFAKLQQVCYSLARLFLSVCLFFFLFCSTSVYLILGTSHFYIFLYYCFFLHILVCIYFITYTTTLWTRCEKFENESARIQNPKAVFWFQRLRSNIQTWRYSPVRIFSAIDFENLPILSRVGNKFFNFDFTYS